MTVSHFHELVAAYVCMPEQFDGSAVLTTMAEAPKFVFTNDVIRFLRAHSDDVRASLSAAIRAGHCELPHAPMVVEYENDFPGTDSRFFWLIDNDPKGRGFVLNLALLERHLTGRPVGVVDDALGIDLRSDPSLQTFAFYGPKDRTPHLRGQAVAASLMALLLHVRGIVTRPPREVSPKLDNARTKRGQLPVTKDYVTVHIGYVTDRSGRRHDYAEGLGGHVRVHLRRGHMRNQACGEGWQDHKPIWIDPVLVNYVPGVVVPNPNYLVVP